MVNIKTLFTLPNRVINKIRYNRSLPTNYAVEDIFLVSYPKSGNTWLRFLIANAIKSYYELDREVNFFTIEDIIPAPREKTTMYQRGAFGRPELPRVLKSHSSYNPYFYRVILLVRDPRDVIVSYYNYLLYLNRLSANTSISEFIRSKKYGVNNWLQHSKSWYFQTKPSGQLVKIFRYEDLLADTEKQLFLVMELLGIHLNEQQLKQAIELSSKDRMKASEKKHFPTHKLNPKMSFVREGAAKKGQKLSEEDQNFIEDVTREMASLLGYHF
jgi:hypothetical protein